MCAATMTRLYEPVDENQLTHRKNDVKQSRGRYYIVHQRPLDSGVTRNVFVDDMVNDQLYC